MSEDRDGPRTATTAAGDETRARPRAKAVPGLVLVFAQRTPVMRVFRADAGWIELGRSELAVGDALDGMISRTHARVRFDGQWQIEDLSSLNGTFVGGRRIAGQARVPGRARLRLGGAVLLAVPDIVPFEHYGLGERDGLIAGPALRRALERGAGDASSPLRSISIEGEPGSGKELVARHLHAASAPPGAPFTAVQCAALPKQLAERLLFGTRDGASDAPGYVHSAAGGTLFLEEVTELSPEVQGQLTRLLETQSVLPLGATRAEPIQLRVHAACSGHLRDEVARGRLREDLYFRIAEREVCVPALRERLEEVPWHVQRVLDAATPSGAPPLFASASFVDACLGRVWPGNVRELCAEVQRAADHALGQGAAFLAAEDLGSKAGQALAAARSKTVPSFPEDDVARALTLEAGNVLGAARRLGVHRNKVRRWLERYHLDAGAFKRRTLA